MGSTVAVGSGVGAASVGACVGPDVGVGAMGEGVAVGTGVEVGGGEVGNTQRVAVGTPAPSEQATNVAITTMATTNISG